MSSELRFGADYAIGRAESSMKILIGRHLRREHGWGRRKLAAYLGVPETWIRDYCDEEVAK